MIYLWCDTHRRKMARGRRRKPRPRRRRCKPLREQWRLLPIVELRTEEASRDELNGIDINSRLLLVEKLLL